MTKKTDILKYFYCKDSGLKSTWYEPSLTIIENKRGEIIIRAFMGFFKCLLVHQTPPPNITSQVKHTLPPVTPLPLLHRRRGGVERSQTIWNSFNWVPIESWEQLFLHDAFLPKRGFHHYARWGMQTSKVWLLSDNASSADSDPKIISCSDIRAFLTICINFLSNFRSSVFSCAQVRFFYGKGALLLSWHDFCQTMHGLL